MPRSDNWEGAYIDDHLLLALVEKHKVGDPDAAVDSELLERSRQAYLKAGLPRALKKGFERQLRFTVWGSEVDSTSGRVGAPEERRLQLLVPEPFDETIFAGDHAVSIGFVCSSLLVSEGIHVLV